MNTEYGYSRRQLLAMCTVFFLAPALRLVPAGTAQLAGRAAWAAVPAALPVILLYLWFLHAFLCRAGEGEGFAELTARAVPARLSRLLLIIYALWFLLYGGFMLRSGADRIITTVYPNASPHIFVFTMGALGLIAALDSARTLVRSACLFLPAVLGVLLLVLFFALFSIDKENLLPLTLHDAAGAAQGAVTVIDVAAAPAYMVCFMTGLHAQKDGGLRLPFAWALGIVGLMTWLIADIIGCFGAELAARLSHPFFTLVKNLVFFRNLERVEALVVSLWVFSDFVVISLCLMSAQHCLRLAMGKRAHYAGERALDMRSGRWVIWLCAGACVACSLLIAPEPRALDFWSRYIIPGINLAFGFVLLPLVYLSGRIRKTL